MMEKLNRLRDPVFLVLLLLLLLNDLQTGFRQLADR